MEPIANVFINILLIYLALGFAFGIPFVIRGVQKIDSGAKGTSWAFRLLIFPGTMAFWPVLLSKWLKANQHDSNA